MIVKASEFVYLASTPYNSLPAFTHLSRFASTNLASLNTSSMLSIPSVSAVVSISANSSFVPDTAVLIFQDQFCHCSSPPRNTSILSNPFMINCCDCLSFTPSRRCTLLRLRLTRLLLLVLHLSHLLLHLLHQFHELPLMLQFLLHDSEELPRFHHGLLMLSPRSRLALAR